MFNEAFAAGLPMAATEVAKSWDSLYMFLVYLSIFFFVLIVGGMLYLAFKYKDKPGAKSKYITDNHALEAVLAIVPTILLLVIFGWGWSVYKDMVSTPTGAMEIHVIGKQWQWQFQYDDGRVLTNEVFVPVGKPVKFIMSSEDVIHSMFIPDFRVKQDVVPGIFTTVWFESTIPGKHQIFCTEYCGTSHSGMLAKLFALEEKEWSDYLNKNRRPAIADAEPKAEPVAAPALASAGSLVEQGKAIYAKTGCTACHNIDGAKGGLGPSFKGIYGTDVEVLEGGSLKTVKVDDVFLRESIEDPAKKVVKGFNPVMPVYKGQLKEADLNALIAFIRSLK